MVNIKRKIKLLIFFLIFIIISPVVVLYANGDIFTNGWNILKTGGIYVTKAPIGSEIFLNSKTVDTITFFQRDVLIKNLRPGTYEVTVKKDGYNIWDNKIKVINNIVSDANVFALPTRVELKEIFKFSISENGEGTTTNTKIKNQEYVDITKVFTSTSSVAVKKILSTSTIDFKNNLGIKISPIMNGKTGLWQEKNTIYIAWFGRNDAGPKYLCDELDCTKTINVLSYKESIKRIGFLPGFDDAVVVLLNNKIVAIQIEKELNKNPQLIYQGASPDFRIINGDLYIKDKDYIAKVIL